MGLGNYGQPAGLGDAFWKKLLSESIAEYAIAVVLVGLRTYARIRKLGIRGLQADDYVMFLALAFYTLLLVADNLNAQSAGSALPIPGEDLSLLSEDVILARESGAKLTFMAEQGMLNTIWTLKGCMLLLYNRLTLGARNQWLVKVLAIYAACGYLACQLALFLQCRPFPKYWQIRPATDENCTVYWTYIAIQMAFNISSDIAILFIPVPMIIGVKVPIRQKLILLILFSMGLFVIAAALITKIEYYQNIYDADYLFWYFREASVAMYVSNIPMIWPLIREIIPGVASFFGVTTGKTSKPGGTYGGKSTGIGLRSTVRQGTVREIDDIDLEDGNMMPMARNGPIQPVVFAEKPRGSDEHTLLHGIKAETTIEMTVADNDSDRESR